MGTVLLEYDIDKILNHTNQPRKTYTQDSIIELANSINKFGLLQPIVLSSKHLPYRVIAGQRRLLAYKYLRDNIDKEKYSKILAIAKEDTTDRHNLYLALIENLHRVDLNIVDKAESFKTLIDNGFAKNHNEIANSLGISREIVNKILKISELNYNTKTIIRENNYANILVLVKLVGIDNSDVLLQNIINKKLSRKEALSYISENGNQLPKTDIKLKKQKKSLFKGAWGRVEITSKQTHIHVDPNNLDDKSKKLLKQLVSMLEKNQEEQT